MNRVYDDEDNEPMDDSLFVKDVYGIFHDIRKAGNERRVVIDGIEVMNNE